MFHPPKKPHAKFAKSAKLLFGERFAAEASKNLFRSKTRQTRWIAAVSAVEEFSRKVREVRKVIIW